MKPDLKFQRAARIFLTRLLQVYGEQAPEQLRRVADELEQLRLEFRQPKAGAGS